MKFSPGASGKKDRNLAERPIEYRCVALTGAFETGARPPECFEGLAGNFGDQGLSLGALQWNFGQGTLQPLLQEMARDHGSVLNDVFQAHYPALEAVLGAGRQELLDFARSIQDPANCAVKEPWRGMLKSLCRTGEFHAIQVKAALPIARAARRLVGEYGLWSERGVALMFDVLVQNGNGDDSVRDAILADFSRLSPALPPPEAEVERMRIIAERRAAAADPLSMEDVRAKKLCIANGHGMVHGAGYHLERQFGIRLVPEAAGEPS
ncbi:MAG: peptidoglycan-binding protein [Betaproteobacteria bacterium]|nr:peptidoglycan-binding protein [Betaproteobacteria bacterium]